MRQETACVNLDGLGHCVIAQQRAIQAARMVESVIVESAHVLLIGKEALIVHAKLQLAVVFKGLAHLIAPLETVFASPVGQVINAIAIKTVQKHVPVMDLVAVQPLVIVMWVG